jgi:hypothetical protein
LVVLAFGAFLFIPAGLVFQTFWSFCLALFILSCGLACIETAANPYVTVLGPKEGAAGRLSVAQAFNSCAYILAPPWAASSSSAIKRKPARPWISTPSSFPTRSWVAWCSSSSASFPSSNCPH